MLDSLAKPFNNPQCWLYNNMRTHCYLIAITYINIIETEEEQESDNEINTKENRRQEGCL